MLMLQCVYTCISLMKCKSVQSQATVGLVGVFLVILSAAAGLGICSVIGVKFNAATTQVSLLQSLCVTGLWSRSWSAPESRFWPGAGVSFEGIFDSGPYLSHLDFV